MRPEILFPLFAPVTALPGVGPRIGKLFEKVAGPKIVDMLWHLPREIIDRRFAPKVADAPAGRVVTLTLQVDRHDPAPRGGRRPYRVRCRDETGFIMLVFFHAQEDFLRRALPEGSTRIVSGTVEFFDGGRQMTHPDHIVLPEEADGLRRVEPVYPLTGGLTLKTLGRAAQAALDRAPDVPEWLDREHLKRKNWPAWRAALLQAHAPESEAELSPLMPARERLAYDELLANQLALALTRSRMKRLPGRSIQGDRGLRRRLRDHLPFAPTASQETALVEIDADMAASGRMLRLLQGDVGSGKTVVALFAMLNAVECGGQAAIMAPTEILARQHFNTIEALARPLDVGVAVLTGREKTTARRRVLEGLADGSIAIVIGTHALFQKAVEFRDLMLVVIDEQHRFGVHQRLTLAEKGRGVDTLVMTATPIPRSLLLTAYGDLDASRLLEKPAGRKPIDTRAIPLSRLEDMIAAVGRAVQSKAKVYWVCPLVEESEVSDLAAAEARQAELKAHFGDMVEMVHGRMKGVDKDAAMDRFAHGSSGILVATTVIEVGIDVPEASVMVIEHAERFGLAQLHQLRGRIGRGERKSTCLLLYGSPLTDAAKARIEILRQTEDGFRIAEEDLRLRGGGEVLGTRQSGLPEFRLADLSVHGELLATARDDACLIIDRDPELRSPRGAALRVLLYLFERDAAVVNLRSG